jgi:hypothetical protein
MHFFQFLTKKGHCLLKLKDSYMDVSQFLYIGSQFLENGS